MGIGSNLGYAAPDCVSAKSCVPVTIENKSGLPVNVLIHGSATKTFYDFVTNTYTPNFISGESTERIETNASKTIYLPGQGIMGGGRMYFSTDELTGIPDLATYPSIYDKIELGWTTGGTAGWNTTSVDFFGMPIQLIQGNTKIGFKDDATRDVITADLQKEMEAESDLYDARFFFQPNSSVLRIFSPLHFYTNLPDKWAPVITKGLANLATDNQAKGTGVYFNFTYGGTVFTNIKQLSADSVSVNENGVTKIITEINTGNASGGQIKPVGDMFAGMLSEVINRGILANHEQWGQNGGLNVGFPQFYYQGPAGGYLYNTYAKVLVNYAIDAKIYATSYDDYWHMDPSIQVGTANNTPVIIKLLPFEKSLSK